MNPQSSSKPPKGQIGLLAAIAIGIGGMVGAGIFSILGVVALTAGNAMWISFLIGGAVALLTAYSYAHLGTRFPSAGGAVEFLVQGFGDGVISGGLNLYMWFGYIIALALYAQGFVGYAMTFFPSPAPVYLPKALGVGIVLLFTGVNFLGARAMGQWETLIVGVKLGILLLFAGAGVFFLQLPNFSPSHWPAGQEWLFGAGIIFIGYEGFGLVTNAAEDMADPRKLLPRALYLSVILVILIYLAVSLVVIGNLDIAAIASSRDYALAEAAKPFLGLWGFKLVAVGALFSTASAINATLYGGANISYMLARDGELPELFERKVWSRSEEGLFITAGLVILFVLFFDLSGVAMMGSGAFLFIYACVNAAHLRIIDQTGARKWLVWAAMITCFAMFVILSIYIYLNAKPALITMVGLLPACLAMEWVYRKKTGRVLKTRA
ncbi:MAG: amino acid permease [Deltaproteobacteria bacterium]|nr:MAG: amino acid permease [Deltaproteobacteria bacterium]